MASQNTAEGLGSRGMESSSSRREKHRRSLYVSKACNECRRRKLRCDGDVPCLRCTAHFTACSYVRTSRRKSSADSEQTSEFNSRVFHLQRQLDKLARQVDAGAPGAEPVPPAYAFPDLNESNCDPTHLGNTHSIASVDRLGRYRGPTSAEFCFKVATSGLQQLQPPSQLAQAATAREGDGFEINASGDSELLANPNPLAKMLLDDPLREMSRSEVRRLISIFNKGPGQMYPIVETSELVKTSERLFQAFEQTEKAQSVKNCILAGEKLASAATITLKLVLANALTLESCQVNRLSQKIFDSVRERLGSSFWALPDLGTIVNWILVAFLHFHYDEELQGARATAHAARLCLEMGINRKDAHRAFKHLGQGVLATKLVWTIFVIDRGASIALGIPFVMQNSDLDASLPDPGADTLYLKNVVCLSRIAGDACRLASQLSDRSLKIATNEIDYLGYQICQWQAHLPASLQLRLEDLKSERAVQCDDSSTLYKNSILFLRANQLRNLIYRPVLYSTERIAINIDYARIAIDVARESLQVLHGLSNRTQMLHTHPILFKYFLMSAFSVFILAIAKSPVSGASSWYTAGLSVITDVKAEFYIALDLFKLLSARSPPLLTLWNSVSALEAWACQKGLPRKSYGWNISHQSSVAPTLPTQTPEEQYHGLSLPVDATRLDEWAAQNHVGSVGAASSNAQLANELSSLLDTDLSCSAPAFFDSSFDLFMLQTDMRANS